MSSVLTNLRLTRPICIISRNICPGSLIANNSTRRESDLPRYISAYTSIISLDLSFFLAENSYKAGPSFDMSFRLPTKGLLPGQIGLPQADYKYEVGSRGASLRY